MVSMDECKHQTDGEQEAANENVKPPVSMPSSASRITPRPCFRNQNAG